MHVLICIHSLGNGGAERMAGALANEWARAGRTVTLVTLEDAAADFQRLDPAVRRLALAMSGGSDGWGAAIRNNWRRVRILRRVLKQQRPDVALAMMNTTAVLLAIAGRGLSVVSVGAERVFPAKAGLSRPWSWLRYWCYGWLDAVVAQTPEAADWLRRHTRAGRVEVIPNHAVWPLPDRQPLLAPDGVGVAGRRRLLAVGRLTEQKGMDILLEIFAGLGRRHPDWELVIVGEGPVRAELTASVEALGLADRVFLVGRAGNLADWYRSAHLFVLPSRFEGFPNVLVEAMAHGLPCVAFDCPAGPRHIIRDGVDGELVPDQDVDALANALERMMADEALRKVYGERARDVLERFAFARIMALWDTLFDSVSTARVDWTMNLPFRHYFHRSDCEHMGSIVHGCDEMTGHASEVASGERFEFGANWAHFLNVLNDQRIALAEQSLCNMLGVDNLTGKHFLDIGSGSGLFSLAARRLGATVHSFDYDPQSVACTTELKRRYYLDDPSWVVEQGSVLDIDYLQTLGQWDVVYSWGVLHHTGAMWNALENVIPLVKQGGMLFISIYNYQRVMTPVWTWVKRVYNRLPNGLRWLVLGPALIRLWGPRSIYDLIRGKPFQTWRHYAEHSMRGMSAWRDVVDWVGGYPFEVAKPEDVFRFYRDRGFVLGNMVTCGGGLGCNEFVFIRASNT